MTVIIQASCSCGRVSFSSSEQPVIQFICHCSDCRAATKAPFTETAIFSRRSCDLNGTVERYEFIAASGANTTRDYCPVCGDVIFDCSEKFPELVGVLASRILEPFEFNPSHHIWTQSKLPDHALKDDLPHLERGFPET